MEMQIRNNTNDAIIVHQPLKQIPQGTIHYCTVYMQNSMKCPQAAAYKAGDDYFCLRHGAKVIFEEPKKEEVKKEEKK